MKDRAAKDLRSPRDIAIDVTAFNDVAVFCLASPRSADEVREQLSDDPWPTSDTDWQVVHQQYAERFKFYTHDEDTLGWRDRRQEMMRRRSQPKQRGARRT